jgi:type II secretory pathway component PulF
VATPPEQPFGSDTPHWEPDDAEGASGPQRDPDISLDPAVYSKSRLQPWRLSHAMFLIAAIAVLLWLGILFAGSAAIVFLMFAGGGIFVFTLVMGAGVIVARRASTRQDSLLWLLAIAAERNMPLAPAAAAFADQYRGLYYRRVMDLAAQLNWGTPLPEALERARKVVSRDAVLLAWVGEAAGLLPKALRLAADTRSSLLSVWTGIAARIAYILVLLLGIQTIAGFILYYIMPKFEAISSDFGLTLPGITKFVISFSLGAVKYGYVFAFVPMAEIVVLFLLPLSFLSWGNFNVPVFDRLLGRRHTALVLRALSLIVEGGKPIAEGLSVLAGHYPTYWIHRRLRWVETDVRQGVDWIQALLRNRLIRAADAEVLVSAAKVGNLSWALTELASSAERRLATQCQILIQTLFPLVVVMLGMVVFVMAVAYFMPLIQIIQGLTDL